MMKETDTEKHDLRDAVGVLMTVEEADKYTERLQNLYESLYKKADSLEVLMKKSLTWDEHGRVMKFMLQCSLDPKNVESLGLALMDIKEYVLSLPTFHITVAFPPRAVLVDELRDWLALNGPGMVRLQFETDSNLVGGAVVGWDGKIFDYSLRQRLGSLFEKTAS